MAKILQINKFFYLRGGSERYLFELSKLLEAKGHKVIHFSMLDASNQPSRYEKYFAANVNVNQFGIKNILKSFYNWDAAKKLQILINTEKPDLAHLHNIANHLSPAIIRVLKNNGIKIVQTLHDYKLVCPNRQLFSQGRVCFRCQGGKFYHCLTGKCIQNSRAISFLGMTEAYFYSKIFKIYDDIDLFLAPSNFMKETVIRSEIPPEKVKVIHNFMPADFFPVRSETVQTDQGGKNYLLYFGRLSEEKGINVLLKAMEQVRHGLKLKIAGVGPDYKKINSQIDKNGLKNKVEIVGPKYGEELHELIAGAKAVVIPSVWLENFPYSLLEAIAKGKVVVASKIGGIPEIIKDGENGLLFTPGDSNDLLAKIEILDRTDLVKMGNQARESVKKFNQEQHYNELINIYRSLLDT